MCGVIVPITILLFIFWVLLGMLFDDDTAEMLRRSGFPCDQTTYVGSWGETSSGFTRYIDCADGNAYVQRRAKPLTVDTPSTIYRAR